jgi:hypothetical protein
MQHNGQGERLKGPFCTQIWGKHEVVGRGVGVLGATSSGTSGEYRLRAGAVIRQQPDCELSAGQWNRSREMVSGFDGGAVELAGGGPDQRGLWNGDQQTEAIWTALGGIWKTLWHAFNGHIDGQRDRSVAGGFVGRRSAILPFATPRGWHPREIRDQDNVRCAAPRWDAASSLRAVYRKCRQQLLVEHMARTERERGGKRIAAMCVRGGGEDVGECVRRVLARCAEQSLAEAVNPQPPRTLRGTGHGWASGCWF